jgi:nucleotide-binding universal stress UspA family protein
VVGSLIEDILFPVDFSPSCAAMAADVKRAAALFGARVTLVHVFDLTGQQRIRTLCAAALRDCGRAPELAREKLASFLRSEFRSLNAAESRCRVMSHRDCSVRQDGWFRSYRHAAHGGSFRRMLLGSTTAKVLNNADCSGALSAPQ